MKLWEPGNESLSKGLFSGYYMHRYPQYAGVHMQTPARLITPFSSLYAMRQKHPPTGNAPEPGQPTEREQLFKFLIGLRLLGEAKTKRLLSYINVLLKEQEQREKKDEF